MGPVMSLAKPHMAKQQVIKAKGITKLTPSFVNISLALNLIFIVFRVLSLKVMAKLQQILKKAFFFMQILLFLHQKKQRL